MRAISTRDVHLETLREFRDQLRPEFELEVDESQIGLYSAEPPSWIHLLAEADWWVKGLAAYAAVYVGTLVQEAAKETWRSRAKILTAVAAGGCRIKTLAGKIARLRDRLPPHTALRMGLPIPDGYFATLVALTDNDPDQLVLEVALFVHHVPALVSLIRTEELAEKAAAGVFITICPNGDLEVSWCNRDSLDMQIRVLPLSQHAV